MSLNNKKIAMQVSKDSLPQMLKILRKRQGYTLQQLADLCQLSPSYISRIEAGGRRYNTDILEKLSAALGCDPYDLLRDGESSLSAKDSVNKNSLPVYGVVSSKAAVNASGYSTIDFSETVQKVSRITPLIGDKTSFAFYIVDSMNAPKYNEGDFVFAKKAKKNALNSDVAVIGSKNELMIGKVISEDEDFIEVSHYNGKSKKLNKEMLQEIYLIVGTYHNYK